MKTTWNQNCNEIREAYRPRFEARPVKVHGEEVVTFQINFETPSCGYSYLFDAPRCSDKEDLLRHAYYQVESSTLKMILDGADCYAGCEKNISFRVYTPPAIA